VDVTRLGEVRQVPLEMGEVVQRQVVGSAKVTHDLLAGADLPLVCVAAAIAMIGRAAEATDPADVVAPRAERGV
jgi:hypothetical protein